MRANGLTPMKGVKRGSAGDVLLLEVETFKCCSRRGWLAGEPAFELPKRVRNGSIAPSRNRRSRPNIT
jgi:hypothetical protein